MRKTGKIACSILLASVTVSVAGSGTVFAATEKNESNTFIGTSKIASPEVPKDNDSPWTGSYVYFGKYGEGDNKEPIKFRVLAPATEAYGDKTMLLDSDQILFEKVFSDIDCNEWEDSDIQEYLNGTFLDESFTLPEQYAIAFSSAPSHELTAGTKAGNVTDWTKETFKSYTPLSEEKIFLLDVEEATNISYGYSLDCKVFSAAKANRKKSGASDSWWLRSPLGYPESENDVAIVTEDGNLAADFAYKSIGIAPALNIDSYDILFSTKISGEINKAGAEYKLTLLNEDLSIKIPDGKKIEVSGRTVTVPYKISGADANNTNRASVLIVDPNKDKVADIIYYGALKGSFSNSNAAEGTFTLPDSLDISGWGKDYMVFILAEDTNGDKESDYSSEPVTLEAPQGAVSTITYKVVNGTWADGTTTDKTETVERGKALAAIPSGMIASAGFGNGSWNIDPSSAVLTGDTTFTYSFEALPIYTVTFDSNGHGTAPDLQLVYGGKKIVKPSVDPVDGWTFEGWYTDKECTAAFDFSSPVNGNMELYAKWTEFVPTATATPTPTAAATGTPTTEPASDVTATPTPAAEETPAVTVTATPTATVTPAGEADTPDSPAAPASVKKGDVFKDKSGNASYLITSTDPKNLTVAFAPAKKGLASVNIPAEIKYAGKKYKVTEIKANAFKNNKKLKKVTIGKNIKKIGKNAFLNCKNLKNVLVKTSLLTKKSIGKNAFKGINAECKIKVPKKKLSLYDPILKKAGIKGKKQKISK